MTISSPNKTFINTAECSAKKLEKDNKRKATDEVKSRRRKSKYTKLQDTPAACRTYNRHDGGITPDDCAEDISKETLEKLTFSIYETKVVITSEQAKEIEQQTRDQASSDEWKSERRKRITASKVGGICKMREKPKRSKNYCTVHFGGTSLHDNRNYY